MPRSRVRVPGSRPFLDIVSYGRGGPSERQSRLQQGEIAQITRTVRHAPEVMVKISGGGQSAKVPRDKQDENSATIRVRRTAVPGGGGA